MWLFKISWCIPDYLETWIFIRFISSSRTLMFCKISNIPCTSYSSCLVNMLPIQWTSVRLCKMFTWGTSFDFIDEASHFSALHPCSQEHLLHELLPQLSVAQAPLIAIQPHCLLWSLTLHSLCFELFHTTTWSSIFPGLIASMAIGSSISWQCLLV